MQTLTDEQVNAASIRLLADQCEAYREMAQFVVDKLHAVNCLIDSRIKDKEYWQVISTDNLKIIQCTNQEIIQRVRG